MTDKIISHFDVTASALTAERARMRIIASNIANINTTRTEEGGPYKKRYAILQEQAIKDSSIDRGVKISAVYSDDSAPRMVYEPNHPDANNEGYVAYPNIDIVDEVTKMKTATLAYQANVTVLNNSKQMISQALKLAD